MIRPYTRKDANYIIHSHYELYNREFHYDLSFRDFIAKSVDGFIKRDDGRENIWIIEIEGKRSGSISIKKVNDHTAQLGLFLIEPSVRGTGYGRQLIETALQFCKKACYKRVILWTNRELTTARRIYKIHGFKRMESRKQLLSNKELIEERWELSF